MNATRPWPCPIADCRNGRHPDRYRPLAVFRNAVACVLLLFPLATAPAAHLITVKLLVDEEQPAKRAVWETQLRQRLELASAVLSQHCGIRLAVAGFDTWQSDNRLQDLAKTLGEFEQEVDPRPGQIAIGFSSQYKFQSGRNHLGGTRGPMRPHILLRESNPRVVESERIEALVHELGHYFGAAHSSQSTSAMRPVMGDGQTRLKSFRIGFDPANAQVIRLVAREIQARKITQFQQLSPQTLAELRPEYAKLVAELPNDPTAARYLTVVDALLEIHARNAPVAPGLQLPADSPGSESSVTPWGAERPSTPTLWLPPQPEPNRLQP